MRDEDIGSDEVPLLTKVEAIAEVRKWLEVDRVDPEMIFAATGETTLRYKDLLFHLEQETPDGKLLLFAISRGRLIKTDRDREVQALLRITASSPPHPEPAPGTE